MRLQLALALLAFALISLSLAGLVLSSAAANACWLGLLLLLALQILRAAWMWRGAFWSSYVPALATAGTLVLSPFVGHSLRHKLLVHRFHSHRLEYDAVADRVAKRNYPQQLLPQHQHLAQSVMLLAAHTPVFVVNTDASLGATGLVRIDDPTLVQELMAPPAAPTDSMAIEPLEGNWYLITQ